MRKRMCGVSLVELLLVLTILALLVASLDSQGFARSRDEKQADGVMSDIVSAISMARQAAILENVMVTYCRSDDGMHCQGNWQDGSIIFTDRNADRRINGDDRLLHRLDAVAITGSLRFKSFRNRQYLQMTPFGFTNYQNGNFTWCPANRDNTLARQVIVSMTARTRYARDSDGDGIIEDSQGKPLTCDL